MALKDSFFGHYINAHTAPSANLFVRTFLYSQLPSSTGVCRVCGWLRIRRQLVSGVVVAGKQTKEQHPEPEHFSSFPPNRCSLPVNRTGFVSIAHTGNGKCCRCKNEPLISMDVTRCCISSRFNSPHGVAKRQRFIFFFCQILNKINDSTALVN